MITLTLYFFNSVATVIEVSQDVCRFARKAMGKVRFPPRWGGR